jgi:hypothetical protein
MACLAVFCDRVAIAIRIPSQGAVSFVRSYKSREVLEAFANVGKG